MVYSTATWSGVVDFRMLVALAGGRTIEVASVVLFTISIVAFPWKVGLGIKVTVATLSTPMRGFELLDVPGGIPIAKVWIPGALSTGARSITWYSPGFVPKKLS